MKFSKVSHIFEQIEKMSSRKEMTFLLSELLTKLSPEEAQIVSYLSLGSLFPSYKNIQFGMSNKSMLGVLARFVSYDIDTLNTEFNEIGDLGLLAQKILQNNISSELSIEELYQSLVSCVHIIGKGSQEHKQTMLFELLKNVDACSAKYIVRIILGTMRLGCSDMTFLDALSWMETGSKKIRVDLEHAYNVCADLGYVSFILKSQGLPGIQSMHIQVGIPIRSAAAERANTLVEVMDRLEQPIAQPKLDGFRVQVHMQRQGDVVQVHFFSRNLLNISDMFPELNEEIAKIPVQNFIAEGEAIIFDEETETFLPFQETIKRKRKHNVQEASENLPLRLYLFDLLYLNGQSLLSLTHVERRSLLSGIFIDVKDDSALKIIEERKITSLQELEQFFLQSITAGLEGLVVKRPDAIYQPGSRNFNWIKLKRHVRGELVDTIDVVIMGYYYGRGKRTIFGIGAFLVGIYNKETDMFESIAKVGTGLTDLEWNDIKQKCDEQKIDQPSSQYHVMGALAPDVWVAPYWVCTIQADEISLSPLHSAGMSDESKYGYALRFPRFIAYRFDKGIKDITDIDEIRRLYQLQRA